MEIAFVLAPGQNHFFVELVAAMMDELEQLGVRTSRHVGAFPPERDDLAYALVPPHEWFALQARRTPPSMRQLSRTVTLCAEQPQTSFFIDNALLAPLVAATFDISPLGIAEFRRHKVSARHFQLGWTRTWTTITDADLDAEGRPSAEGRDIDVLHLGIDSPRRARALSENGTATATGRNRLVLAHPSAPNDRERANFVVDDSKLALLRRTKVLVNIHQDERPYFEWLRVVQAMCQGVAVVTEPSLGAEPLLLGEHLAVAGVDDVMTVAHGLVKNEEIRATFADAGHRVVRESLPLRTAVEQFADAAEQAVTRARSPHGGRMPRLVSPPREHIVEIDDLSISIPHDPVLVPTSSVRRGLKDLRLELMQLRRDLRRDRLERSAGRTLPRVVLDTRTPGWREDRRPVVSVITALYNHQDHIEEALETAFSSRLRDIEIVVVDDGSTDGSLDAVRAFAKRHSSRPVTVLHHVVNSGLGAARNSALGVARGEFVFVLDADNHVLPPGIGRLVELLRQHEEHAFAYGMLEMFNASGSVGLLSRYPWEPKRLRAGNYIDAMALWRASALRELGGYTTDHRLYGWEDYDLWCRCAERGVDGSFLPDIVARYRTTMHSMISTTDLSVTTAWSVLSEQYPALMAGVVPPP